MSDLHYAATIGDVAALREILDDGVSPNTLDQYGQTPLHQLCDSDDDAEARVDCLHVLLEAGANIHAPDQYQRTPLHYAAGYLNAIVAALLEAGADVNRGDANGQTPLHWACARSDAKPALILLIRNGADLNARDHVGETPLDWAIDQSQSRLVPTLLRAGAALPAQTDDAYLRKVIAAGGFEKYAQVHLARVTKTVKSTLGLPARPARRVAEYAFHAGNY